MAERIMVFPCEEKDLPFVEVMAKSGRYEGIYVVIPHGESIREAHAVIWESKLVHRVANWEEIINQCSIIWIPEGFYEPYLEREIARCVECGRREGKEIYYEKEVPRSSGCLGKDTEELYRPGSTVIAVGECFEGFGSDDLICGLVSCFEKRGWKSVVVTVRNLFSITGMRGIPEELNTRGERGTEAVLLWNRYVRYLEETYAPDILLIQVPGGLMQFPGRRWDFFGIRAQSFFLAVQPDLFYAVVPFNMSDKKTLEDLKMDFYYRLGMAPDNFFLSDRLVDFHKFRKNEGTGKLYASREDYLRMAEKSDFEGVALWDQSEIEKLTDEIEKEYLHSPFELVNFQF